MTITKRLSAIALTLIMLVSLIPMTVFAAGKSGWEEIDGEWYYYQDDQMLKSTWLNYKSKWYYFDQGGMMMADTFFKDIDEKVYVFDKSGAMVSKKGWYMIKMYYGDDISFNLIIPKTARLCADSLKIIFYKYHQGLRHTPFLSKT